LKSHLPVLVATAAAAIALPVIAQADHKPSHGKPGNEELSITAKPNPTVYRNATVISGSLKAPDNEAKTVVLYEDAFPFGTDVKNVGTTTTDAKGDYTFTRSPARNTSYQAVADRGTGAPVVNSQALIVGVRIRMTLRVSDNTPATGQLVRFRGRACPAHDGLRVRIQRKTPTGAFRTVRRTRLRAAARCSTFAKRMRVHRDGTYRVTSDDADHTRGYSRERVLNAHG
jgi:hypothetical protein